MEWPCFLVVAKCNFGKCISSSMQSLSAGLDLSLANGTPSRSSRRLPSPSKSAKAFLLLLGCELYSLPVTSRFLFNPLLLCLMQTVGH